jgi:hypothetical protein
MPFWNRKPPGTIDFTSHSVSAGGGSFRVDVVGESFYLPELKRMWRLHGPTIRVALVPEPRNKHDPNAVRVDALGGATIGYLSAASAQRLQPHLLRLQQAHNAHASCEAKLGGNREGAENIGVFLNLDVRKILATK